MLRRRAGLSHVTLTLPQPRLTLTQKQTDLPMVMLKQCAQPRGTDLWSLVLPRWGKIHIYKPFMGEICNYVFITDYTIFIQQKSAFIILLPQ